LFANRLIRGGGKKLKSAARKGKKGVMESRTRKLEKLGVTKKEEKRRQSP